MWRGVACLFVVVFHSTCIGYGLAFPNGPGALSPILAVVQRLWIGVPLFFVISGYCVTASADAARRRPGSGLKFFQRRFRRIYPPYWAWLAIAAVTVWVVEHSSPNFFEAIFVPNPARLTKWQWLGNLTLTESWRWHLTGGVENALLSPSWTLCYEEQFYALVGLSLILSRRFFFHLLSVITVLVLTGILLLPSVGISTSGTFLDGKWLLFAAGALVYYVVNYAPERKRFWLCLPLGFGALCAFASPEHLLTRRINEPNQSYLCGFLFALGLAALHRFDSQVAGQRRVRFLVWCGEMCYSLYLIHWPVVTLAGWAFNHIGFRSPLVIFVLGLTWCVGSAIGLARIFHMYIERKFWNPAYSKG